MKFKRSLENSGDEFDLDLKSEPFYLVFPYSGGRVINDKIIGKHTETPKFSKLQLDFSSDEQNGKSQ